MYNQERRKSFKTEKSIEIAEYKPKQTSWDNSTIRPVQNIEAVNVNIRKNQESNQKQKYSTINKSKEHPPIHGKNTENFNPSHEPLDMRVRVCLKSQYENWYPKLGENDCFLVPDLFSDYKPQEIYRKLLDEIASSGVDENNL